MSKTQSIFGWAGGGEIFEVLRQEFDEEKCKMIYNILFYRVETKVGGKTIKPFVPINNLLPWQYAEEKGKKEKTVVSYLYGVKYSAYDKINRLQQYIDVLNCKYCTGLKINFAHSSKGYTFLMYFDEPCKGSMKLCKVMEYAVQWDRMKAKFTNEPQIHVIDYGFFGKSVKPVVPWVAAKPNVVEEEPLPPSKYDDHFIEDKEYILSDNEEEDLKMTKKEYCKKLVEKYKGSELYHAGLFAKKGTIGPYDEPIAIKKSVAKIDEGFILSDDDTEDDSFDSSYKATKKSTAKIEDGFMASYKKHVPSPNMLHQMIEHNELNASVQVPYTFHQMSHMLQTEIEELQKHIPHVGAKQQQMPPDDLPPLDEDYGESIMEEVD